jgi:hypothetical protein
VRPVIACLVLLLAACPKPMHKLPAPVEDAPFFSATSVGVSLSKPPVAVHSLDVVLRNPAAEARWLVLPTMTTMPGETWPSPTAQETEVQPFVVSEAPYALVAYGVAGNFWAVRLPGGGAITLRGLKIEDLTEEVPAALEIEALLAREITIGGRPLADLVGVPALSETGADAQAPIDAADPRVKPMWHPDGPAPVAIDVERRGRVRVAIKK